MPKENEVSTILESAEQPAAPTPVPAEEITGLPVEDTSNPRPSHGTVAELLSIRKEDSKDKATPEDEAKEKALDKVDKKLNELLFKGKPKKSKEAPAKAPEKEEEGIAQVPEKPADTDKPAPAKAPARKAPVKDRATELREQELELEKQRLALERERLELEKSKSKPASPAKDDEILSALSPEERYEYEVYQVMGGDIAQKFLSTAKATAKYRTQWEKDHPGESFDPDDSEHDSFFAANQVKYDKKDFRRAELKLASQGEDDPKIKELEDSNRELKAKSKLRDLEPQVANTWARYADAMIEAVDPEIAKLARSQKGHREAAEAIMKEYPEEGKDILMAAEALGALAHEAYKILEGDGLFVPDESNNRLHAQILGIIRKQEQLIPRLQRDERLDSEGRDFATWEQWLNMNPQQQADHWHLGAEQVVDIVSKQLAGRVRYEIERALKIAESRQKRTTKEPEAAVVKEKPPEKRSPAASPGGASKVTVDAPAKPATPAEDKLTKIIRSGLFKRSS